VTGGRPPSFSRLISGGNRSPRLVGGMRSPAYTSGTLISRRKDPAFDRRESLGAEEKTSRTRDIHSKAFTPGLRPGSLPILDRIWQVWNYEVLRSRQK
jgi:hypothetical protein